MTTIELKKYIYENNKVEYILAQLGCSHILFHQHKEYYSCANPDGDNSTAVNIKNNSYLNYRNFTRNISYDDKQDLISFVEYCRKCDFVSAIKWIHNILNLSFTFSSNSKSIIPKSDIALDIFTKHLHKSYADVNEIEVLNTSLLEEFIPILHIDWYKEGIMPWAREKFGIAYSYRRHRCIIPYRYWIDGNLIGINSRTTVPDYEELGIKKYYITPSYPKHLNLYGLWENYDTIQKLKRVIVFESEKSVLKRYSCGYGDSVALSGKTMSEEQVRILIGLNVPIYIALDNDVPEMEILSICNKFYGIRDIYYVKDKENLLDKKDSPNDKGNSLFEKLLTNATSYDKIIHERYEREKDDNVKK